MTNKQQTLENYKNAKKAYLENQTSENWLTFCKYKRDCMLLGIRI